MIVKVKENIFGDNIAKAILLDFSRGNLNDENRLLVITSIASICYANPKGIGSESLYNRLLSESHGLPSSSFEFVPMLIPWEEVMAVSSAIEQPITYEDGIKIDTQTSNIEKFGQWIEEDGCKYLLTNYRAVVYDYEMYGSRGVDLRNFYNSEAECDIIKKYYFAFKFFVDLPTRSQMVRHRVNLQELSRRYVNGKRVEVKHYISRKMKTVKSTYTFTKPFREALVDSSDDLTGFAGAPIGCLVENIEVSLYTQDVINICMNHYFKSLEDGVAPQEARRIIPQTAYTELYMGFLPYQLENFFRLRDDSHAQWEVRQAAIAMKEMLNIPIKVDNA